MKQSGPASFETPGKKSWEEAVLWMRAQSDMAATVTACYYDDPLLDAARRYYLSREWQALTRLLPSTKGAVLDIGAGRGISAFALASERWVVTALEPDSSDIVGSGAIRSLFEQAGLPVEIVEKWGERLPFENNTFDLVHMRAALHHADDLKQFCHEAARVLKPGGLLVATREHVISKPQDLPVFLESHPLHHLYGGENAFTLTEYTDAIGADGRVEILRILNPLATDINLHPLSCDRIKKMIAARLKFPWPNLIPDWLMTLVGYFYRKPGRLYSFIAKKKL